MVKFFPKSPGVYLFKNSNGDILYIGKAKSLAHRVQSYLKKHSRDWKVNALLAGYDSIDYIVTKNETEALLLESKLIREHRPKFNVLLKDGQPYLYIFVSDELLPKMTLVRNKKEKGVYFGPFLHKGSVRKVFQYLVSTFRLHVCNKKLEHGCLEYHLGICAGKCKKDFDHGAYVLRLQLAMDVLKGDYQAYSKKLEEQIRLCNKQLAFERAKHLHEYLENLDTIFDTLQTYLDHSGDLLNKKEDQKKACTLHHVDLAVEVQQFLGCDSPIKTIDCFDISHFQSTFLVGSSIRFVDGKPEKNKFRRFKIKTLEQQDDCAALQEIVTRRYKDGDMPDLVLIDGGKGQLNAVSLVIDIPCVSLAKREEMLFSKWFSQGKKLDVKTPVGKLFIELRDYAHHFAISYHRKRRSKELKGLS